jgi:hypothetical protein
MHPTKDMTFNLCKVNLQYLRNNAKGVFTSEH